MMPNSIFQLQPFFGDAKRQQPRQTIDPTLTPYRGARAKEYSIEKPEEGNLQAGSSPGRSVPEPRKTVITAGLAPREGDQRRFLPFRNDPPLTRFCAVQVQEGRNRAEASASRTSPTSLSARYIPRIHPRIATGS